MDDKSKGTARLLGTTQETDWRSLKMEIRRQRGEKGCQMRFTHTYTPPTHAHGHTNTKVHFPFTAKKEVKGQKKGTEEEGLLRKKQVGKKLAGKKVR